MKELFKAIEQLLYLNNCEQEGLALPTSQQWSSAFLDLQKYYWELKDNRLKEIIKNINEVVK